MSKFRLNREDSETTKSTRYFSNKQETSVANAIGGKKTANSGATAYHKGDVTIGDNKQGWLIECKTCTKDKKTFTIHKKWFEKNLDESIFMKKDHSAIVFNFGPNSKNYYIIDEQTFIDLIESNTRSDYK